MKTLCFVFFLCFLNTDYISARQTLPLSFDATELTINKYNHSFWYSQKYLRIQVDLDKEKLFSLKYENIVNLVAIILLCITTFLVVISPLVLGYFWIYYSYMYVKKYRSIFSVKKWIFGKDNIDHPKLGTDSEQSYRKVYSLMLGFGISILAYLFSSVRFMHLNFDKMETAMVEYFRFPFLVLDQFGLIQKNMQTEISFDVFWNQMLLIVVISSLFFLLGYLLGTGLVDLRLKFLKKKFEKSNLKENSKTLHIKTKKNQPFKVSSSKSIDFL